MDAQNGVAKPCNETSSAAATLWRPNEADANAARTLVTSWNVAYTHHAGRVESNGGLPSLRSVGDLAVSLDGVFAQAAMVSSFEPFDPAFLSHFPRGIPLTVCITAENKPASR